jgi:uncharacterized protein YkwD
VQRAFSIRRPGLAPALWISWFLLVGCADDRPIAGGPGGAWVPDQGDDTDDVGTSEPDSGTTDNGPSGSDDTDVTSDQGPSDEGTSGDGDSEDDGPESDEVPDNDYCNEVAGWDPAWSAKEEEILTLVNELRATGTSCGAYGAIGPSGPLVMHPALRCAARKHSKDMVDRGFFDHTNPDGEGPGDRFRKAGYSGSKGSENIAMGTHGPSYTVDQWLASDGHCANMMNPGFSEIGVGFYPASQVQGLWTQAFGAP